MSLPAFLLGSQWVSVARVWRIDEILNSSAGKQSSPLNSLVALLVEVRNEPGFQRTTRSAGRAGALVVRVALETVWG